MRRTTIARSVAGSVLALSLAASVPAAAQSPSAAPADLPTSTDASAAASSPAPRTRVLVPSGGFIVSLPADWLVLDFEADPAAALAAFLAVHPELEDHIRAFLATGPMAMMAMAPAADDDPFPATFTSFRGGNMGMSAESMLRFTLSGLSQLPGVRGNIGGELRMIAGQPGLAAGYDWELSLADGTPVPVRVEQFTVVTPAEVWAFSVTDDTTAPDAWRSIADSFELLP